MILNKTAFVWCLLIGLTITQQITEESDANLLNHVKNGMTYQVQQWPIESNNWVGRFGCNGCDPLEGDVPCYNSLPLLCIVHHKVIDRPFYDFSPASAPLQNPDRGYYNGWTGGILTVTPPIRGYDVDSYEAGNQLCQDYWGKSAKFAEFKDGWYMPWMNTRPKKTWRFWNWATSSCGGWALWGYFNTNYNGRAWTWIDSQPHANCGAV